MEVALIVVPIVLGVVGLVVAIILLSVHFDKKRSQAMAAAADELGLAFFLTGHSELQEKLQRFNLFTTGHSRNLKNVILGETDVASIAIFDYRYTTGSGKNQQTFDQTVVAMESEALKIPSFALRPESVFDIVGSALGFQDIDFADHPQFSKSFVLKGQNEEAIRRFFDVQLLDFFAERKGICFECSPGLFIYYRSRKKKKAEELRDYLGEGYSVYTAFMDRLSRG
jgi:hypothetical protein